MGFRQGYGVLAVILLLAAVLRLGLGQYSLWFDEYASLFFAHQPFARLWSGWMVRETNPALFYSILRGWILLIGPMSPVMLRVPSICASLLTILVVYRGLSRTYGEKPAAIAAVLLAVSAQQIFYAQQVRGYSFFALAITVSFFSLMAIVTGSERGERPGVVAWLGYVGGAVAANYFHGTGFLWLPIATLGLMIADRRFVPLIGRDWLWLATADTAIVVGSGWAIFLAYHQMLVPNPNVAWLYNPGIRGALKLFWLSVLLVRDPWQTQSLVAGLVLAGSIYGLARTYDRGATRLAAACGLTAVIVYCLFTLKQPVLVERTLVWIAIFPVTLLCAAFSHIRKPMVFAALGAGLTTLVAINLVIAYPDFEIEDWTGGMTQVLRTPHSAIVVSGEGDAVIAAEACRWMTRSQTCSVPIVTLPGPPFNAWATGYGMPTRATDDGRLALASSSRLFFVQRYFEQPLHALHDAGLLKTSMADDSLIVGPFGPPATAEMRRGSCVRDGQLKLGCPPPPSR